MSPYRAPAHPSATLAAASRCPASLWRKIWHFYRKGWNPFVTVGYAMPFFFAATHWYLYGLDLWMAVYVVQLPLFFGLAISNGVTRYRLSLVRRSFRARDRSGLDPRLADAFARHVESMHSLKQAHHRVVEMGRRLPTPPAPGVVIYRG